MRLHSFNCEHTSRHAQRQVGARQADTLRRRSTSSTAPGSGERQEVRSVEGRPGGAAHHLRPIDDAAPTPARSAQRSSAPRFIQLTAGYGEHVRRSRQSAHQRRMPSCTGRPRRCWKVCLPRADQPAARERRSAAWCLEAEPCLRELGRPRSRGSAFWGAPVVSSSIRCRVL